MKKVLITGTAGFLGSHLAKRLVSDQVQVIGLDNLSTGKMENLNGLTDLGDFTFVDYDVTNANLLEWEMLADVQEIYHLASPASPKFYQSEPFRTMEVNTIGTKHMLELAKKYNAKMVYTSTSEAYGDPEVHPQLENYRGNVNTWGPRACYDEAKRLGEVYCYEYAHRYSVKVKVARIFNTYSAGLRNDDGRVISNFVNQALRNQELTVYGDGSQTRSFNYVDDTIQGLMLMMEREEANAEIINIGNPNEISVLELANIITALTQCSSGITFHPLPQDDPKVRRPDIAKAKRLLGWSPQVELRDGLSRTIQAYKERMDKQGGE